MYLNRLSYRTKTFFSILARPACSSFVNCNIDGICLLYGSTIVSAWLGLRMISEYLHRISNGQIAQKGTTATHPPSSSISTTLSFLATSSAAYESKRHGLPSGKVGCVPVGSTVLACFERFSSSVKGSSGTL